MSHIQAKLIEQDSAFRARSVSLRVGSKSITTPIRALHIKDSKSESRLITNPRVRGLNEIVSRVTPELLNEIDFEAAKQLSYLRALQQGVGKINFRDEISAFIIYFDGGGRLPTDQQIDYLANLVTGSPYNDIILPPILLGVSGPDYAEYLSKFFERLHSYANSPDVMGSIPHIAHIEMEPILRTYLNHSVRFFALDLEGKDPLDMYTNVNNVYRAMRSIEGELGGEECCYLHGLNMKRPRGIEKKQVTPAKDILIYEMGFNSFGSSHIRVKLNPNLPPPRNFSWVLDRNDYGYYATSSPHAREIYHDSATSYSLADVLSDGTADIRRKAKIFNVEQQGLEAQTIRSRIQTRELDDYLGEKAQVSDSLRRIRKKMPPSTLDRQYR